MILIKWLGIMIATLLLIGVLPKGIIQGLFGLALILEFAIFISIIADLALSMTMKDIKDKWRD